MAKLRPNKHTTYLHGPGGLVPVSVPVRPATAPLYAYRKRRHVVMGEEGRPCTCANAHTFAEEHGGAWEFTDSRAFKYKISKKGKLLEAEYWIHNQGGFQDRFDKLGKRAMLNSPECEARVALTVPPKSKPRYDGGTSRSGSQLNKRRQRAHGGVARFERAGIQKIETTVR